MTAEEAPENTETKVPVRLLLAEDQVMIREALAALLEFEGDMKVVAQVGRATRFSLPPGRPAPTWPCSTSRCRAWTA